MIKLRGLDKRSLSACLYRSTKCCTINIGYVAECKSWLFSVSSWIALSVALRLIAVAKTLRSLPKVHQVLVNASMLFVNIQGMALWSVVAEVFHNVPAMNVAYRMACLTHVPSSTPHVVQVLYSNARERKCSYCHGFSCSQQLSACSTLMQRSGTRRSWRAAPGALPAQGGLFLATTGVAKRSCDCRTDS